MSDDWLRAEALWFGIEVFPINGIIPESKKRRRAVSESKRSTDGVDATEGDAEGGRKRRRSVSAERRKKALERRRRSSASEDLDTN